MLQLSYGTVRVFHTFSGPFVEASATEPLFASTEGASPHRQGHRLLRQAEGDEVSPIYEMLIETPAEPVPS
jgi:hypothetical protein